MKRRSSDDHNFDALESRSTLSSGEDKKGIQNSVDPIEVKRNKNKSDDHNDNKKHDLKSNETAASTNCDRNQPEPLAPPQPRQGHHSSGDYYSRHPKEMIATGETSMLPMGATETRASNSCDMLHSKQQLSSDIAHIEDARKKRRISGDVGDLQMKYHQQTQDQHGFPALFGSAMSSAQTGSREMYPHLGQSLPVSYPNNEADNFPHIPAAHAMYTDGIYASQSLSPDPSLLLQRMQAAQQLQDALSAPYAPAFGQQLSMMQAMPPGTGLPGLASSSLYRSSSALNAASAYIGSMGHASPLLSAGFNAPLSSNNASFGHNNMSSASSSLGDTSALARPPFPTRPILPLATRDDENWLSDYLCYVRAHCVEVFTANAEDVLSRNNSKKITEGQVGIRCRFCAHLPHRSRAGRSSCFPSSKSRIYQSLTMMLRDHFPKCGSMPLEARERFMALKNGSSQGVTDSKRYWVDSAESLGMVDDEAGGIRFADND